MELKKKVQNKQGEQGAIVLSVFKAWYPMDEDDYLMGKWSRGCILAAKDHETAMNMCIKQRGRPAALGVIFQNVEIPLSEIEKLIK